MKRWVSDVCTVLSLVVLGAIAFILMWLLICAQGCASVSCEDQQQDIQVLPKCAYRALCIGVLTTADGVACPGADVDCYTTERWMLDWSPVAMRDDAATIAGVRSAVNNLSSSLLPDDLFVVTISGHGTRRVDKSGDESDGYDEGLVLYDGVLWDDDLWTILCELPPCRILFISDTCHSEGNYRVPKADQEPFLIEPSGQLLFPFMRSEDWSGQLIQIAGCREYAYSYGSVVGGTLTQTLNTTLEDSLSYRQWFDRTKSIMGAAQVPVFSTYNATPEFQNAAIEWRNK